ncbi:MAG: class I SAM-dependent methyltransferase family protein [Promethearchaeota archaeon]
MNDPDLNDKENVFFVKLRAKDAQYFIQFIKENFGKEIIINRRYKIEQEGNFKLFPLLDRKEIIDRLFKEIQNHNPVEIVTKKPIFNPNFKFKTLEEALRGKISASYINIIPKSYDVIGNIAILEFEKLGEFNNSGFSNFKQLVAKAVIEVNKNVYSVFEKKSEIKGPYRLRDLGFLVGENNTETIHKENGCTLHLDIKKTYFSPRLVFERQRVSESDINEKEVIVDMFAGVGPFSIQIAKLNSVLIHSFDVNPHAFNYLQKNINSNQLKGKVIAYNMNIRDLLKPSNQIGKELSGSVDRIIMNLPESSMNFIDVLVYLLKKSGGLLHFYHFAEKPNPIENTLTDLENNLNEFKWKIKDIINSKIVKSFSPKAELVVLDLSIAYLNP